MNLLADEGVDRQIVERLRNEGHRVWYVIEMTRGISDDAVMTLANAQPAVLITADKDFGELVFRDGRATTGVILIRLDGLSPQVKANAVAEAVAEHGDELVGAFTVIAPGTVRMRRDLP